MSIGLYDCDIENYGAVIFNLDLMKLAAYYKSKKEIVVMSPSFEPWRHKHFFLRKDFPGGNPQFVRDVEYGGLNFTNGLYVPMDERIESSKPDTTIYNIYKNKFASELKDNLFFNSMARAEHLRLSLDNNTIWSNFESQLKQPEKADLFIFHDPRLGEIKGATSAIKYVVEKAENKHKRAPAAKFPIIIYDANILMDWSTIRLRDGYNKIIFKGILTNEQLIEYIEKRGRKKEVLFQYEPTYGCINQYDFIKNRIHQIYDQAIILQNYRVKFSLIYEDDFFIEPEWGNLLKLFECYANYNVSEEKLKGNTMFEFARHLISANQRTEKNKSSHPFTKKEARDLFRFVEANDELLFNKFYNYTFEKIKGGE